VGGASIPQGAGNGSTITLTASSVTIYAEEVLSGVVIASRGIKLEWTQSNLPEDKISYD
jgi:hypothetical protein